MMAFHSFKDASGYPYGSFETFRITRENRGEAGLRCGHYWQACFPGCMPDGDPMGPFRSEFAAIRDAQEMGQ